MPFMLYDVSQEEGYREYTYVRRVKVGGSRGPLAVIQRKRNTSRQSPFSWHAAAADIVAEIPGANQTQEIIIDLKPNVSKNVSLFRLLDVWGFSYNEWTPLALMLETIFAARKEEDVEGFKRRFDDRQADRSRVGEFLYLRGGVSGGNWNWGRAGMVNGALLWKNAFTYLASSLKNAF